MTSRIKNINGENWFICSCGQKLCQVDKNGIVNGVRIKCSKCKSIVNLEKVLTK